MQEHDKGEVLSSLRDRFSKATDADGEDLWGAVKGESLGDVLSAIKEHRGEKGSMAYRPDIRRIGSLAKGYRNSRNMDTARERVIDFVRRTNIDVAGLDDIAALALHFGQAWDVVKSRQLENRSMQSIRAMIFCHARAAFMQIQLAPDEAEELARSAVDLDMGEKIIRRSERGGDVKKCFGAETVPMAPPSSFEALKTLATPA